MLLKSALVFCFLSIAIVVQGTQTPVFVKDKLPYSYGALEPHIDGETMAIHYEKHHEAYTANLNKAMQELASAGFANVTEIPLQDLLADLDRLVPEKWRATIRNNGGGFVNHNFFWNIMAPKGAAGLTEGGLLHSWIIEQFGSMEKFREVFNQAAVTRFGSGWAWLICDRGKLEVVSTPNQDPPGVGTGKLRNVVIGLDVWEHAYYLKYRNQRVSYISEWWNVVNWPRAEALVAEKCVGEAHQEL